MADLKRKLKVLIRGREDGKTILDRILPDKSGKDRRLEIFNPLDVELGQFVVLDYVDGEQIWAPYELDMEHFRRETWEVVEISAYTRKVGGGTFPYTVYTLHDGEDTAYIWAEADTHHPGKDGDLKLLLFAQREEFAWDDNPDLMDLLESGDDLFDQELGVDTVKDAHWTAELVMLSQDEQIGAAIEETEADVHVFLHQRDDTDAESVLVFEIQEGWVYVLQGTLLARSEVTVV